MIGHFRRFFSDRLSGAVPLSTAFWRDMVLIGTVMNIACITAMFIYLANDGSGLGSLVFYLAPLPINVFLLVSVWRSAERSGWIARVPAQVSAVLWFGSSLIL